MSKKMKRMVMESSPHAVYEDAKSRFKHQSLLQDFHELQKETEAMKKKLLSVNQNKLTLLAEVRFLRRRYKYLLKNMAPKTPPEPELKQPQNSATQLKNITRDKNHSGKQAAAMRNPAPVFGGNMKERIHKGKVAALPNPDPGYELNQKTRGYSGKEAALRNPVPVFDLNKISREEEEVQVNVESAGVEEQKKSVIRGGNDDQHSDMKLSVCRNIGNGPNRAGKRKISWQDQVALRV
ncbi:hypothetical protein VitviT2T_016886 [Vitis vinifera]|uniref:Uncharacterized protein n=2 Tax=Vitis vinifera TaxID=29760 RepID=A0ABY9CT33_VITVI|eukprot:XP_002277707.1 PREDICTED: uncharacterized protein LOC100267212 [Vitis vinifera]